MITYPYRIFLVVPESQKQKYDAMFFTYFPEYGPETMLFKANNTGIEEDGNLYYWSSFPMTIYNYEKAKNLLLNEFKLPDSAAKNEIIDAAKVNNVYIHIESNMAEWTKLEQILDRFELKQAFSTKIEELK